jgi:long-chain acyl-CoA synthetase
VDMFAFAVAHHGAAVHLRFGETAYSYAQSGAMVDAMAAALQETKAGGRIACLLIPNSPTFHWVYYACLKAGVQPALMNPALPEAGLAATIETLSPALIVAVDGIGPLAAAAAAVKGAKVISLAEDWAPERLLARPAAPVRHAVAPEDVAAILFTGGTTGTPKCVEYSHLMLLQAVEAMEFAWPTKASGEVWIPVAPMFHIYGFLMGVLNPVWGAGTLIIPERFKPDLVIDLIENHRATVFGGGPPALYGALMAAERFGTADISSLAVCPAGGAPFPVELMERWHAATGLDICEAIGMTEVAPMTASTEAFGRKLGSVGRATPCNRIEIVDLDTGTRQLGPGERGEIRVASPYMMKGYRGRPDETAATLRDGFILTGDIGYLDEDGFLFVTDRKKDVVFVRGYNVFPREIEEIIYRHPAVQGAGVVGVPDPRTGEKVVAFVVLRQGSPTTPADLASHCGAALIDYKCPADFRIVDELPVTPANKLDRIRLRQLAQA